MPARPSAGKLRPYFDLSKTRLAALAVVLVGLANCLTVNHAVGQNPEARLWSPTILCDLAGQPRFNLSELTLLLCVLRIAASAHLFEVASFQRVPENFIFQMRKPAVSAPCGGGARCPRDVPDIGDQSSRPCPLMCHECAHKPTSNFLKNAKFLDFRHLALYLVEPRGVEPLTS